VRKPRSYFDSIDVRRIMTTHMQPHPGLQTGAIDPLLLPRLMIWSVLAGILSFTVADPDLWGHVRFGLDMIALGGLPAVDPYSFTSDRPWVNHEWLAEIGMATAYLAGGPFGLSLLKIFLLIATFALVVRELAARGVPPIAQDVLMTLAIVGCVALTKTLRPQTFSLLLFAGLLVLLRRVEDGRARWIWWLPPMMIVWANLHGGWLVGIGILGLWTAFRVIAPIGPSRAIWALAGLAALAGTLVNPHGIEIWQFLWATVGLGRADISEWQPLTGLPLVDSLPWTITVVVAAIGVARGRERHMTHLAVVLLLMVVSFRVMRLVPFFAVAVVLLLGPHVPRASVPARKQPPPPEPLAIALVGLMALAFVVASGVATYRNLSCIQLPDAEWTADQRAAAFIEAAGLEGRMLTWFDWGEYAIWFLAPDVRVSMDGRRETIYSDEMIRKHLAIYWGRAGWQDDLRALDPDFIWLPTTLPTLDAIGTLGWQRVFATDRSIVFSRSPVASPAAIAGGSASCFPGEP
jgi:hypothetical protein